MNVYEALYTTRAMRRVRPDPIPYEVQARILDAAIRAPSGGNAQSWRFMLVDDPDVKGRLGPLYRTASGSSGLPPITTGWNGHGWRRRSRRMRPCSGSRRPRSI